MIPIINIVTPCKNMRESIDRTILSVLTQSGAFKIRYHLQDGGSTDGTYERMLWWQREVASGRFPIQCIKVEVTCAQEDDVGMYDAIIKGYKYIDARSNDFLTWINGDDALMPGAFAFVSAVDRQFEENEVSWITGAAHLVRYSDFWTLVSYDRFISTDSVRSGLCDGLHLDFIQQEGTFYRQWLWNKIDAESTIRTMKVGGDWNAWRLMAQHATIVQTRFPLGVFSVREGQLSGKFRGIYHSEMDECVPLETRRSAFENLAKVGFQIRRRFDRNFADGELRIVQEPESQSLGAAARKLGITLEKAKSVPPEKILYTGKTNKGYRLSKAVDISAATRSNGNIFSFNGYWQFPAVTEMNAFEKVEDILSLPDNIIYVAFPWATLIDKINLRTADNGAFYAMFRKFIATLPLGPKRVTTCQHILLKRHMSLFKEAGIDHVFWSHATPEDVTHGLTNIHHPAILPFPLFPVQSQGSAFYPQDREGETSRKFLFSFIGAEADVHYPKKTRNFILDQLKDDKRGFVSGRKDWFYNKVVYDFQVWEHDRAIDPARLIEQEKVEQFRAVLEQSVFSLCPAGTGPNSIRLWESIGAGAIPVILADDWAPPGDPALWKAAAIIRPETPEAVSALPDELEEMARDPALLAAKRLAMRQLWLIYGPDSFVFDIHKLMQRLAVGEDGLMQALGAMGQSAPQTAQQARLLLAQSAATLLLGRDATRVPAQFADEALALLDSVDPVRRHFEEVRARVGSRSSTRDAQDSGPQGIASPRLGRGAVPRLHLFGPHSNRTPFGYEPILREIRGRLAFVDRPETADVLLTGFNRDFAEAEDKIADLAKGNPQQERLVLSEEPFWDTLWSGGFLDQNRTLANGIGYRFVNHENSDLFDFKHLPYFPLTDDSLMATYAMRIGVTARFSPREMLDHWRSASVPLAFFAEHRKGAGYERSAPDRDIWALSSLRTQLAERCAAQQSGTLCVGKGWRNQKPRQDLPSWHLDKLAQLTGRSAICSGLENTHQRHYVSEKIFDAFAVGAVPIYYASPRHRVFDLVPKGAMMNIFGLEIEDAVDRVLGFTPDLALAELWVETAQRLAKRFGDLRLIHEERKRIAEQSLLTVLELA